MCTGKELVATKADVGLKKLAIAYINLQLTSACNKEIEMSMATPYPIKLFTPEYC